MLTHICHCYATRIFAAEVAKMTSPYWKIAFLLLYLSIFIDYVKGQEQGMHDSRM